MKSLVIDIETIPASVYTWGLFDQNIGINQVIKPGGVVCWAAKWAGKKKVYFKSSFHHGHEEMVQAAWDLIDEADALIHFNGRSFDVKHLNREFLLQGMTPPSPHKDIDLLTATRSRFKFLSNKLQFVSEQLGLGSKTTHTGFSLWEECMAGNPKAWALMKKYNIQDVHLTERLYDRLLPWIKSHPHVALIDGHDGCQNCGGTDLRPRGFYFTNTGQYQRRRCHGCGTWSRDRSRAGTITTTQIS